MKINKTAFIYITLYILYAVMICGCICGCAEDNAPTPPTPKSAVEPNEKTTHEEVKQPHADDVLPGMQCMVNKYGIRRKVIIAKHGIRGSTSPGLSPIDSEPLPYFRIYFLHDVYPESARNNIDLAMYFHIGLTPRSENLLWIPATAAVVWDHRVLYSPDNELAIRRPPLTVYAEADAIENIIISGRTSASPIARYNWQSNTIPKSMPWPIIETKYIKDPDGNMIEISKIAFLAEYHKGSDLNSDDVLSESDIAKDAYSKEEIAAIKQEIKMCDIVVVIDNTASTEPFLEAIRTTVQDVTRNLSEIMQTTDLNLGLVLYRDYVPNLLFNDSDGPSVTQVYALQSNISEFKSIIAPLRAPTVSSDDYPEAVYDGVNAGLTQINWRGNKLATRCIVLIGDNSAHEPGHPKNPNSISMQTLISKANEKKIHIFSLCITGGGGDDEQNIHWSQFKVLAESTGGECFRFDENRVENIVKGIDGVLKKEAKCVDTRQVTVHALSEGKRDEEIIQTSTIDQHEFTEVMEFLIGAGIDPEKIRRSGPTFCTGWILPVFRGTPICTKKVYMARSELRILISCLQELSVYCDPSFGDNVMRRVLGSASDGLVTTFLKSGHDAGPFDINLIKKGIPLSSPLLRFTPDELTHMSEDARSELRSKIEKHYLPLLMNALNDDHSFVFGGLSEFGFINSDTLP